MAQYDIAVTTHHDASGVSGRGARAGRASPRSTRLGGREEKDTAHQDLGGLTNDA